MLHNKIQVCLNIGCYLERKIVMDFIFSEKKALIDIVENILYEYNNKHGTTPYYQNRTQKTDCSLKGCYALENNEVIGGVVYYIAWDWMFIDSLALEEKYQRKQIGRKIMENLEALALKKKLVGIKVSTLDFQAKGFYEKLGFHVLCELHNCPRGNTKYELVKYLEGK